MGVFMCVFVKHRRGVIGGGLECLCYITTPQIYHLLTLDM